ncbi:MAG TPA: TraR/DksA family transcriptional regulator [Terriglobales bacterium]|nr:TraR/DksA family transcriptional regulator [Terriglobales bacterium]
MITVLSIIGSGVEDRLRFMNQADVKNYRAMLISKRDEIRSNSRLREDIRIVQSNEQIETVQLAGDREFAVRTLERGTLTLTQIGAALQRIADGEFGICLDCEEPISSKRLAAVPWAAYCLRCQEFHDTHDATGNLDPKLAA